jgi:hypothetical protein
VVTIMTTQTRDTRFYVFIKDHARRLIPSTVVGDADLIRYAEDIGADLIIAEDGPKSKPYNVRIMWSREDTPNPQDRRITEIHTWVQTELADRFPDASVRMIGEAAWVIAKEWIKEGSR